MTDPRRPDQLRMMDQEAAPIQAEEAERERYREELRRRLQDPAFRAVEGFPIGEDEAILDLSDPPYYTACPNPFLLEIVERWRAERGALRAKLGLPDDSREDANGEGDGATAYHREPFAADVSEGKNDPIYNAHSYHTKVPHKAIMRYILHYTEPGDVVFDGFCGTGMTGVAAQLCGDRKAVEGLGYRVDEDGMVRDGENVVSRLGARRAVLVDLSPAATFIAYNYNTPVDPAAFEREAKRILAEVEAECGWMYETWHPHCDAPDRVKGRINYTVWSDVFVCPSCGREIIFWDAAVDKEKGDVLDNFPCPGCRSEQSKRSMERAWETVYDPALGDTLRRTRRVPVLMNYSVGKKRREKVPDGWDDALLGRVAEGDRCSWFPTNRMPQGDESRRNDDEGTTHVHHFYVPRGLAVQSRLWAASASSACRAGIIGGLSVGLRMARFRVALWVDKTSGPMKGLTSGTLYIPSLSGEQNWLNIYMERVQAIKRQAVAMGSHRGGQSVVDTRSATSLNLPENSVDYVFTDPPFGANLWYSELNSIAEAWLGLFTNTNEEAVVNQTQRKRLGEYERLMERCFAENFRLLRPGRWMTVEFHNSSNIVWNAIQEAVQRAGFVVADVRTLDKQQGSFKQVTTTSAVKQDLIISAYKPRAGFERRFAQDAGSPEGAWDFVRQHLAQLPTTVWKGGNLEVVLERRPYLLFDRMVAFHLQRGAPVPLSAAEFYRGLKERFPMEDGMHFLQEQLPAYLQAKARAGQVEQLTLFVTDEKSAVRWLQQQLDPAMGGLARTYQGLQPLFLQQLHQARHEALPELLEMLQQSALQDDTGRWYWPDPDRAADLERIRLRSLLTDFASYATGTGRLRQFRTEAVRAGFADAYRRRDYATLVRVARRLPESVLQEDQDLLMYYDNATLRAEDR